MVFTCNLVAVGYVLGKPLALGVGVALPRGFSILLGSQHFTWSSSGFLLPSLSYFSRLLVSPLPRSPPKPLFCFISGWGALTVWIWVCSGCPALPWSQEQHLQLITCCTPVALCSAQNSPVLCRWLLKALRKQRLGLWENVFQLLED